MDWIKVKIKHIEYQFSSAPAEVFKTWILVMSYVAATECKPLRNALRKRYGNENVNNLDKWCAECGVKLDLIIDKVLEDVEYLNRRKSHYRKYMSNYRRNALRKPYVRSNVKGKIREDKIRNNNIYISHKNDVNAASSAQKDENITQVATLSLKNSFLDSKKKIYPMLDVEGEIRKCVDWHTNKGRKIKDWERAITNWLSIAYDRKGVVGAKEVDDTPGYLKRVL